MLFRGNFGVQQQQRQKLGPAKKFLMWFRLIFLRAKQIFAIKIHRQLTEVCGVVIMKVQYIRKEVLGFRKMAWRTSMMVILPAAATHTSTWRCSLEETWTSCRGVWSLHQDNSNQHSAHPTEDVVNLFYWEILDHPPQPVICLGHWSDSWDVTDSVTVMKRKWLFVNGRECKDLISDITELLNLSQDEKKNAQYARGLGSKFDTALEWMRYI